MLFKERDMDEPYHGVLIKFFKGFHFFVCCVQSLPFLYSDTVSFGLETCSHFFLGSVLLVLSSRLSWAFLTDPFGNLSRKTNSFPVFVCRMLSRLSELIWADWIWFPEGFGWADLNDADGNIFPKMWDLWATVPIALCFLVVRQIFEQ